MENSKVKHTRAYFSDRSLEKDGLPEWWVDQLRMVLEQAVVELAKRKKEGGVPTSGSPRQSWQTRLDDIKSVVVVEAQGESTFQFKAFVGTQPELATISEGPKCREMNDKCVICPDGKIYCTIVAIRKG
jgi:hypothetical protein